MDERLQFVARRLAGEPMSDLCREFGISRKTGYKIFDRYQACGVEGLTVLLRSGALQPETQPSEQHPAVSRTSKEARHAEDDWRHLLILPKGCLDVRVTKGSVQRCPISDGIDIRRV